MTAGLSTETDMTAETIAQGRTPPGDPPTFVLEDGALAQSEPGSIRAESIGALRTHIVAQHLPAGRRGLALCSPTAGVGCTSLALNLAVALAETGLKTLLIDADLRNPSVDRLITPSRTVPGLAQLLSDPSLDAGDAIQFDVRPNLSILYAGGQSDRARDLLAGSRFERLAAACLRDFDVTIVDTPPSSQSADARRVASMMTYALIVVGRDKTYVSDVKVLADELRSDNAVVIGSALNQL